MCNSALLPYFVCGPIVKGFGRGSTALGIPTANFPEEVVDALPESLKNGIYFGWASLEGEIFKMVMSVGWNPFYKNEKKSMETHILHKFPGDLHGKQLKILIMGYIRPERNFPSVDELVNEIHHDIQVASERLDEPHMLKYKSSQYFRTNPS